MSQYLIWFEFWLKMRLNKMSSEDGLVDNELFLRGKVCVLWRWTAVMAPQWRAKGHGSHSMRARSAWCVHEVGGVACGSVPAQPYYVPIRMQRTPCSHFTFVASFVTMFKGDFVQLSNGPCETIKIVSNSWPRFCWNQKPVNVSPTYCDMIQLNWNHSSTLRTVRGSNWLI